jgi:hypothetical protein
MMPIPTPPNEPSPPPEYYRRVTPPPAPPAGSPAWDVVDGLPGATVRPVVVAVAQAMAEHAAALLHQAHRERDAALAAVQQARWERRAALAAAEHLRSERDEALARASRDRAAADAAMGAARAWGRQAEEARAHLASAERHRSADEAHLRAMLWGPKGEPPAKSTRIDTRIEARMTWHEDARDAVREVRARVEARRASWKDDDGVTR